MDLTTGSSNMSGALGGGKKCDCGLPVKIVRAKTEKNPGRRFLGCQLYKVGGSEHCNYFAWLDEEEVKGWPQKALIELAAENREKERIINQQQFAIMELRSDLEKYLEEAEKRAYRQRWIITCLAGILVCTFVALFLV